MKARTKNLVFSFSLLAVAHAVFLLTVYFAWLGPSWEQVAAPSLSPLILIPAAAAIAIGLLIASAASERGREVHGCSDTTSQARLGCHNSTAYKGMDHGVFSGLSTIKYEFGYALSPATTFARPSTGTTTVEGVCPHCGTSFSTKIYSASAAKNEGLKHAFGLGLVWFFGWTIFFLLMQVPKDPGSSLRLAAGLTAMMGGLIGILSTFKWLDAFVSARLSTQLDRSLHIAGNEHRWFSAEGQIVRNYFL